jgi:hypothetical protein
MANATIPIVCDIKIEKRMRSRPQRLPGEAAVRSTLEKQSDLAKVFSMAIYVIGRLFDIKAGLPSERLERCATTILMTMIAK